MDKYKEKRLISEGRFGQVMSAVHSDGQNVAIKKVYPRRGRQMVDHWSRSVAREIAAFEAIDKEGNHPNIIKLMDHFET